MLSVYLFIRFIVHAVPEVHDPDLLRDDSRLTISQNSGTYLFSKHRRECDHITSLHDNPHGFNLPSHLTLVILGPILNLNQKSFIMLLLSHLMLSEPNDRHHPSKVLKILWISVILLEGILVACLSLTIPIALNPCVVMLYELLKCLLIYHLRK